MSDGSELVVVFGALTENLGPDDFAVKLATAVGENDQDAFASQHAGMENAGDSDGDGTEDLWVGAPWDDTFGSRSGALYLFLGSDLTAAAK